MDLWILVPCLANWGLFKNREDDSVYLACLTVSHTPPSASHGQAGGCCAGPVGQKVVLVPAMLLLTGDPLRHYWSRLLARPSLGFHSSPPSPGGFPTSRSLTPVRSFTFVFLKQILILGNPSLGHQLFFPGCWKPHSPQSNSLCEEV